MPVTGNLQILKCPICAIYSYAGLLFIFEGNCPKLDSGSVLIVNNALISLEREQY